ncbi:MAG TPA: VWA domain-containing protein [Thermotogota bacterium]|jgi:hypothetical protein|nr:VWA domain-containing protein [Thermotogota bacterium]NLH19204.1 VWA domain-containing protein [Thermotogaceae bacterium]OQC30765.1 MAG: hypothetical protein BWX67_01578 [Thermotogota bacterium ADurb.Bin062]HNW47231.1 VWA domain-containing protein [Thermotogota bacterium]HOD90069.1 VWA domain-containing protein [Thermotogota bacterium]
MSYESGAKYMHEISRASPTALVFLIDQSGSMSEKWGGSGTKSSEVAMILNRLLNNLIMRCTKSDGVRNYFSIGVIGYGLGVKPVLKGNTLFGRDLIPISEIADNPLRIERRKKKEPDGVGGVMEIEVNFPIWLEAEAFNGTPMCGALDYAHKVLERWVDDHPDSYPPTVFNITDGQAGDGDPAMNAAKIKRLETNDGNVLLFNINISSDSSQMVKFPDSVSQFANDPYAVSLYNISSVMPENIIAMLGRSEERNYSRNCKGFILNADAISLIEFLNIGTRTDQQIRRGIDD